MTATFQSSQSFATQLVTSLHGDTIATTSGSTDTGMTSSFTLAPRDDRDDDG